MASTNLLLVYHATLANKPSPITTAVKVVFINGFMSLMIISLVRPPLNNTVLHAAFITRQWRYLSKQKLTVRIDCNAVKQAVLPSRIGNIALA